MTVGIRRTIPWWWIDLGREVADAARDAVLSRHVSTGPIVARLESALATWLGVPHVVAVGSGAAALTTALLALGVGRGDEVIVPGYTFVATANAVLLAGASPIVVDVESGGRSTIAPRAVNRAITDRTRAIIAVHPNGRSAKMTELAGIAKTHGISLVEDAAQAMGSQAAGQYLGTTGEIGCFSMSMTKLIVTGEGGFCATSDPVLAEAMRRIRNHGATKVSTGRFPLFGFNFRLTDVQAAMALAQVDRIELRKEALLALHRRYRIEMKGLTSVCLRRPKLERGELPMWIEAECERRDELIRHLRRRGIQAKPLDPPLDRISHLKVMNPLPNARRFAETGLILPSGPDRTDEELERVFRALREFDAAAARRGD
ncbi:MAG: DegT/DnrJ/EryC1/StrS family aminotransferase [Deltaproteobacteria bacterium]|nr:DegT/DnrJ/EryC1/StrS family aminotransferase [Deltaproteobacteria bacterium]